MNKSTTSPKQILKKRVVNNKQLKVAKEDACDVLEFGEKEREPFKIKKEVKKKFFKARDRELKEDAYRNPYALPERLRVTTKSLPPRKVKPVPFIMDDPHTVCDIDPEFYKIVEGRPIRSFYDITDFMTHLRDITLFRADAAYLNEEIIQIETRNTTEQEEYEEICTAFENIQRYFVVFAEESYSAAKYMQKLAEEKAHQLATVIEQLEAYSFEFNTLKNLVSTIVATYSKLTRYKKFLLTLAPDWWKQRYEEICNLGSAICINLMSDLESEEVVSVTEFKKNAHTLSTIQGQLYFRRPMELIAILECMGRQCLNYMEIETYFSSYLETVTKHRKEFAEQINSDCTDIQEVIEIYTNKLLFFEERKAEYKAIFEKKLQSEFYRLFASYEFKELFTCLQYVHAHVFDSVEDPKDTVMSLMYDLEWLYFKLCNDMESLNLDVVKRAKHQMFAEDLVLMRKASDAQRQLREYYVLSKSLYKSFEPPRKTRN